jgi:hypothetical protein
MIMAEQYVITDVGQDATRGLWYVQYQKPNGLQTHWFHVSTLEWRAAEYGLDDVAEILDIVLHEPFMDPEIQRGATVESLLNPAPARPAVTTPVTLWTAQTTTQARDAHRQRIRNAKARVRVVAAGDPLAVIRERHGITPEGIAAKRETVDTHRWITRYGSLPAPAEKEAA